MRRNGCLLLCALLGSANVVAATDAAPPAPLAFRAEARVEVDGAGKVVAVAVDKTLPEPVRQYVAKELGTWSFAQRPREGHSGNASTWLSLSACAIPDASGAYSMGLAFHGNGPRIKGGDPWVITEGMGKVVAKNKLTGKVDIHFVVNADGSATLESVDGLDDSRESRLLRDEIESMVELNHFDTEQIDGKSVATRETLMLTYGRGDNGRRSYEFGWQTRAMQSRQCVAARAAGAESNAGLPVVSVDSVVDIDPSF
ncbi:TonB family protein [Lysobacter dokdonensis DS-58]|uniref:TonB family protein n=1 Tax=Lysobacter dokdonensis DS-58 TaxID=1300345 RepID=A0A0A2WF14_9GAMM|nr:hypothetical protein [Lysobacter dokdonensis]KGQ18791.1 TonB family protein [Lysobacter dokdonensis DS-58]